MNSLIVLRWLMACIVATACVPALAASNAASAPGALSETIAQVQPKVVKIYGAGGLRGLEAYQTGMLISAEGHVLTVWSYVLDSEETTVVLSDGRRLVAKLLGADPRLEIAVLKIEAKDLPFFDLDKAVAVTEGTRVLALSNLFGVATGSEPVSVQRGVVSAKADLQARRGVYETPYTGPVYVLDTVTNNPGAAGGALVTWRGELVGMLGKELRNARNNTWLNYAVPVEPLRAAVAAIRAGKSIARKDEPTKPPNAANLADLGVLLVPEVVERTPPYVDRVLAGSPAAAAGLRPDDLIVLVNDRLVPSCKALRAVLQQIDAEEPLKFTVLRANEMFEFSLKVAEKP